MGANTFQETSAITDVREAFNDLVAESRHRDGVQYSGEIGMKDGFDVVQRTPISGRAAAMLAEKCTDDSHSSKWGPAAAIAVGTPTSTKTRTVTIHITDVANGVSDAVIAAAIAAKLDVPVEQIGSYEIVDSPTVKYAYSRIAGTSKSTRVWRVNLGRTVSTHRTKTEAMAAARKSLAANAGLDFLGKPLLHVTPADSNRSLSVVEELKLEGETAGWQRTLSSYKAKFTVEVASSSIAFSHWLFVGWASS